MPVVHVCTFPGCQYTSPRSNNFERHLRTHTGAPPPRRPDGRSLPSTAQPNPRALPLWTQGTSRTDATLRAADTPRATPAPCSATAASTPGSARHGVTSPAAATPSPTSRARAPPCLPPAPLPALTCWFPPLTVCTCCSHYLAWPTAHDRRLAREIQSLTRSPKLLHTGT